jgi:hypothetical protein
MIIGIRRFLDPKPCGLLQFSSARKYVIVMILRFYPQLDSLNS